ncbi:MAG: enoyl-CoA hydratase/isomerase family protein [Acidocella sp.]|nr:enoyl-CoA hydratase/isomerase family protein [Acidocella sp.]
MYDVPDEIKIEADGGIRIVTLNRPKDHNAATTPMLFALSALAKAIGQDDEAKAVILTGAGKAFSSGGDFQHLIACSQDPELSRKTLENSRQFIAAMMAIPIPVIAAVNGAAVGFGATLAALCDLVLIADTAFFAEPHVNVGLVLGDGISVTWPLYMSMLKAKEYIFTGDRIAAEAAVACGLANRVVAHGDLMAEALLLAKKLEAQPSSALRGSKALLNMYHRQAIDLVLNEMLVKQFAATQGFDHRRIVQGMIDSQKRNKG